MPEEVDRFISRVETTVLFADRPIAINVVSRHMGQYVQIIVYSNALDYSTK
jgi:hypothetical protein